MLEKYRDDPLIRFSVQPHSTYTCSPDRLLEAKALADEFCAIYAIHASETAQEVADVIARHGASPPLLLEQLGILDDRVVLVHAVHLSDEEIELLADRDTRVVHNPESNLKLAAGVARLPQLLGAGVKVGLGTDGTASNNDPPSRGGRRESFSPPCARRTI